jgi:hypothetical protein
MAGVDSTAQLQSDSLAFILELKPSNCLEPLGHFEIEIRHGPVAVCLRSLDVKQSSMWIYLCPAVLPYLDDQGSPFKSRFPFPPDRLDGIAS